MKRLQEKSRNSLRVRLYSFVMKHPHLIEATQTEPGFRHLVSKRVWNTVYDRCDDQTFHRVQEIVFDRVIGGNP